MVWKQFFFIKICNPRLGGLSNIAMARWCKSGQNYLKLPPSLIWKLSKKNIWFGIWRLPIQRQIVLIYYPKMCIKNMAISICVLDMAIPICVLDNRSWQQNGDQPQLRCFEIYIYLRTCWLDHRNLQEMKWWQVFDIVAIYTLQELALSCPVTTVQGSQACNM